MAINYRKFLLRIPEKEQETIEWLNNQENINTAIRKAISYYIQQYGVGDINDFPTEINRAATRRRGRPRKSAVNVTESPVEPITDPTLELIQTDTVAAGTSEQTIQPMVNQPETEPNQSETAAIQQPISADNFIANGPEQVNSDPLQTVEPAMPNNLQQFNTDFHGSPVSPTKDNKTENADSSLQKALEDRAQRTNDAILAMLNPK